MMLHKSYPQEEEDTPYRTDSEDAGALLGLSTVNYIQYSISFSMEVSFGNLLPCLFLCYTNSMAMALVSFEVDGLLRNLLAYDD